MQALPSFVTYFVSLPGSNVGSCTVIYPDLSLPSSSLTVSVAYQMQFLFSCLVNMYFKAGHTVDAVGLFYGGDCSPTPSVSTWWVPYIQRRKPVISLGQCSHSWYSPTCSKHERRPKALPTRRTPCALRTSIWINFYGGICSHSMSGRARKDLVETRALGTNEQLKTPSQFEFEGKDAIVKQIWCF